MKVKSESEVAQSCPTLSDPVNHSLRGSFVHGIFQARVLEWGAIAFSGIFTRRTNTEAEPQYFGHLIRADPLTLMLGKIESKRRRVQQRMQ